VGLWRVVCPAAARQGRPLLPRNRCLDGRLLCASPSAIHTDKRQARDGGGSRRCHVASPKQTPHAGSAYERRLRLRHSFDGG
jgi:hypothetical protein